MSILKTKTIGAFNESKEVKETPVNMNKVQSVTNTNLVTKGTDFFTIDFDSDIVDSDIFNEIMRHKPDEGVRVLFKGVSHVIVDVDCYSCNNVRLYIMTAEDAEAEDAHIYNTDDLQYDLRNMISWYVSFNLIDD